MSRQAVAEFFAEKAMFSDARLNLRGGGGVI